MLSSVYKKIHVTSICANVIFILIVNIIIFMHNDA